MANETDPLTSEPTSATDELDALKAAARAAQVAHQALLLRSLEAGDAVFFKTASAQTFFDLDPKAFDDFTVLAAFAQGLPYVMAPGGNLWSPDPADFKPWHHVGICTAPQRGSSPPQVAQFVQAASEAGDGAPRSEAQLEVGPLVIPDDQTIDVLRGPVSYDGGAAAAHANAQVGAGTGYATVGLLAFALATAARMLTGEPRRDALWSAYGAHVRARALGGEQPVESCTTAAAIAIEDGLGCALALAEPPEPSVDESAKLFAFADTPHARVMRLLLGRVERAGVRRVLSRIDEIPPEGLSIEVPRLSGVLATIDADDGRATATELLGAVAAEATERIRDAHGALDRPDRPDGLDGRPPGFTVFSPGPDISTGQYLGHLEVAIEMTLTDASAAPSESLQAVGKRDLETTGHPNAGHLVLSPAMLWDALVAAGFRVPA